MAVWHKYGQRKNKKWRFLNLLTNLHNINNALFVPETTMESLDNLQHHIRMTRCNIISVIDVRDPLYDYQNNTDWWEEFFDLISYRNVSVEVHTGILDSGFPAYGVYRMVYHLSSLEQIREVRRDGNEIVRVVFNAFEFPSPEHIEAIADEVAKSKSIDELCFQQDEVYRYCYNYLESGDGKRWIHSKDNLDPCYMENELYENLLELRNQAKGAF